MAFLSKSPLMSPAQWSHDDLCVKTRVAVIKIRNVHYIKYIGFRMVSCPRSDSSQQHANVVGMQQIWVDRVLGLFEGLTLS